MELIHGLIFSPTGNNTAYVRRIVIILQISRYIYVCYSGYNNNGLHGPLNMYGIQVIRELHGVIYTGNLPECPVHSLLVDNNIPTTLYIVQKQEFIQSTNRGAAGLRPPLGCLPLRLWMN